MRWLPTLIVLAGAALRLIYALGSDVRNVYDDHFHVTRIMVNESRWPAPAEGWQTYQPPLYHWLSGVVYRVASLSTRIPDPVTPTRDEIVSAAGAPPPTTRHWVGRKAIQLISTASGIIVLICIAYLMRALFPDSVFTQSCGVALAAFQPRLIYMSGMCTNDALVFAWAALAVTALVRALMIEVRPSGLTGDDSRSRTHNGERRILEALSWWGLAGVATAAGLWTKGSALGLLPVIVLAAAPLIRRRDSGRLVRALFGPAVALTLAVGLGAWPYVRLGVMTGNPLVSNAELRPHTMFDQLPGTLAETSFTSFEFTPLLRYPWAHVSTARSFWTIVYAEAWFDYGTSSTAYMYRPWLAHAWPRMRDASATGRQREVDVLSWTWDPPVMPGAIAWQARFLYLAGLVPTALVIAGGVALLARRLNGAISVVLLATAAFGLLTLIFQATRYPVRSCMKATFTLWAAPAYVALAAVMLHWLESSPVKRAARWIVVANLVALAVVVTWHVVYLAWIFPSTAEYFARRDLL